jgi:hypothetical protein
MGQTIRCLSPSREKKIIPLFITSVQTGCDAHPVSYSMGPKGSFHGKSGQCLKLTIHLHLVLRLRTSGVMHLVAPALVSKGTTLHFTVYIHMLTLDNYRLLIMPQDTRFEVLTKLWLNIQAF